MFVRNKPAVSVSMYRAIFVTDFNLEFGSPRSDTCTRCETLGNTTKLEVHKEKILATF